MTETEEDNSLYSAFGQEEAIFGTIGGGAPPIGGVIDDRDNRKRIMNLTQHTATPEQRAAGVFDLGPEERDQLRKLLTFESIPTLVEVGERASKIAALAAKEREERGVDFAMIGGAPYLLSTLEEKLKEVGVLPLYAFSKRESVEETLPDGSVRKVQVFKHLGCVRV